jgi:hypothetical protein
MSAASKTLPQKSSAKLSPGMFAGVLLAVTAAGAGAVVFFFNPSTHPFYPVCLFHAVTGLNCPGCGMTRALYALLHGNFPLAFKDNALLVAGLAGAAIWSARLALRKIRNQPVTFDVPPKVLWTSLIIALVFAVLRNLPGLEWLSP